MLKRQKQFLKIDSYAKVIYEHLFGGNTISMLAMFIYSFFTTK